MLTKDENLDFLQNKIRNIKSAMFSSEINSELQLPNNIISTLKTDRDGNIWFFTSCNGHYAQNVDRQFYACLDYYQKGGECRLRVNGKASIVENSHYAGFTSVNELPDNMMLIKLKILKAEYFENKHEAQKSLKEKVVNFFTELFIPHSYRSFNFTETNFH